MVGENRKVLRHDVAEVGAEHTDIEAATVAHTHNGLGIDLIRDANTRSEGLECVVSVTVFAITTDARNSNDSFIEIRESTLLLAINGFWKIDFPAQPVIEGQLRGHAPSVLAIEEPPLLPLGGVEARAHKAIKVGHIAEQERGQVKAAVSRVRRATGIEFQLTGAVRIARHPEVLRITNVCSELDLVIPLDARPVIHNLELIFLFGQWTVATTDVQTVTERPGISSGYVATRAIPQAVSSEMESGQAAGRWRAGNSRTAVQAGNTESVHRGSTAIGESRLRVIPEPTEAHVGKPLCPDRLVEAGGQAVIVYRGTPVQASRSKPWPTKISERSIAGEREVIQAKAPENLEAARRAVVNAGVKAVLVVRTRTRIDKIIKHAGACGRWECRQDIARLLGNPTDGDQVASKSSATGTVSRNAGGWIEDLAAAVDTCRTEIFAQVAKPGGVRSGIASLLNERCGNR